MKKLLIICVGLMTFATFADTSTQNVETQVLNVIERLGDIERIDVTAEIAIVEDNYNDEEVMSILEEGEALEGENAELEE